jgi:histone H3/H4
MIAAVQSNKPPATHVMSVAKFERFFRLAASLNVDKQDLKRYSDFINQKIYDLLLRAQAIAKANGRVIIEPFDLPITKGLQESIHEFEKLDEEIELRPIFDQLTARPPLGLAYGEDVEDRLPEVVGGLSVALARTFKIIDPNIKNPQTEHWHKCFQIFDLLM